MNQLALCRLGQTRWSASQVLWWAWWVDNDGPMWLDETMKICQRIWVRMIHLASCQIALNRQLPQAGKPTGCSSPETESMLGRSLWVGHVSLTILARKCWMRFSEGNQADPNAWTSNAHVFSTHRASFGKEWLEEKKTNLQVVILTWNIKAAETLTAEEHVTTKNLWFAVFWSWTQHKNFSIVSSWLGPDWGSICTEWRCHGMGLDSQNWLRTGTSWYDQPTRPSLLDA